MDKKISIMWKWMNILMLSCQQATELIAIKQYKKIPFIKSVQLKMHLMVCHYCRQFNKQNSLIDHSLEKWFDPENIHPTEHISEEQKLSLKKFVETK